MDAEPQVTTEAPPPAAPPAAITIPLKPGKQKRVAGGHPWVFAGEVQQVPPAEWSGRIVRVQDSRGAFLGQGYLNTRSSILVRLLTRGEEPIDDAFWRTALDRALLHRQRYVSGTDAYRLVFAEADGLPALVVDRYADTLVLQSLALGIDVHLDAIADHLMKVVQPHGIYERSDVAIRHLEGLEPRARLLRGQEPPELVKIREGDARYLVDVRKGQKTGFFLDQRLNRAAVASHASGRKVLNAFCYTGAFSVATAMAGATEVTGIDVSAEALALAAKNAQLNGVGGRCRWTEANAFDELRRLESDRAQFDMVILDPPAFTKNKDSVPGAIRGYKEINLRALKLLPPGGILVTSSCSHHLSMTAFQHVVRDAATDARRTVRVIEARGQAPDHPVNLAIPETDYLKCLILAVD